jgi:hypothetical protein
MQTVQGSRDRRLEAHLRREAACVLLTLPADRGHARRVLRLAEAMLELEALETAGDETAAPEPAPAVALRLVYDSAVA